jgi:hypothetical protein
MSLCDRGSTGNFVMVSALNHLSIFDYDLTGIGGVAAGCVPYGALDVVDFIPDVNDRSPCQNLRDD